MEEKRTIFEIDMPPRNTRRSAAAGSFRDCFLSGGCHAVGCLGPSGCELPGGSAEIQHLHPGRLSALTARRPRSRTRPTWPMLSRATPRWWCRARGLTLDLGRVFDSIRRVGCLAIRARWRMMIFLRVGGSSGRATAAGSSGGGSFTHRFRCGPGERRLPRVPATSQSHPQARAKKLLAEYIVDYVLSIGQKSKEYRLSRDISKYHCYVACVLPCSCLSASSFFASAWR